MRNAVRRACSFALAAVAVVAVPMSLGEGAGDHPRDFVLIATAVASGVLASLLHTRLVRDEARAARAESLASTLIRYFLAFEMTRYGVAKLVGMQFYPRYSRLDMRVVDLPPSALAWSFFGGSYAYQAFSGVLEIVGALLICFRRTTILGACLLVGVMSNVVLVNFFYDVQVKLFSSIYLAMTAYLLSLDGRRLWAFFVGDAVPPRKDAGGAWPLPWPRAAQAAAVLLAIGCSTAEIVYRAHQYRLFSVDPLEGAWDVTEGSGLDDVTRWDKIYFEKGDYGFIRTGKKRLRFESNVDENAKTIRLSRAAPGASPLLAGTFDREGDRVRIDGLCEGKPVSLLLTRDFPRHARGAESAR